jgi:hypothetical protein
LRCSACGTRRRTGSPTWAGPRCRPRRGTPIASIHHPNGDYKRISFGSVNQEDPFNPQFSFYLSGLSPARFYGVFWSQGVTEPGSSGSPLLNSSHQIIGQLWGGYSSCIEPNTPDAYGRFSFSYPLMEAHLGGGLRVLKPNGGETWEMGKPVTIQWTGGTSTVTHVRVELLKGSTTYRILADNEPNDGTLPWTIPTDLVPGADYRIRVSSAINSALSDTSDGPFTLLITPQLRVVAPNGGERWSMGSVHNITWEALGLSGSQVRIDLVRGGAVLLTVAESTENDGVYAWMLPDTLSVGSGYGIRISTTGASPVVDESDEGFSVSNDRDIFVVHPNGGERLLAGTRTGITWTSNGLGASPVRIELIDVAGKALALIADSTENDGAYDWTIPQDSVLGSEFRVRITAINAPTFNDASDAPFSIESCAPAPPTGLNASDGQFDDRVRLAWSPVSGATDYRVYRATVNDVSQADPLSWWINATTYDDYTAEVVPGTGCNGAGGSATVYYYWVRARNTCAEGPFSASEPGYRGTGKARAAAAPGAVFSKERAGDTLLLAGAAAALLLAGRRTASRTVLPKE